MPVQTVIKLRRDTAANWESINPILASGEEGYETDTGLRKIGNGTAAWGALPYMSASMITQTVKNTSGSTMPKGSVVYISSATGGDASVSLSDADSEATSSKTLGLLASSIANDALGQVVTEGILSGLDTSSATAGDSVWLSSTAGGFAFAAPPAKPAHSVYLGVVLRVHATEGEILVKVQNGYELEELHNVAIASVADKNVLQYDAASSLWKNAAISAGVAVSETAPSAPTSGDLWFNSSDAKTYIYYDSAWVELAPPGEQGPTGPAGPTGATGATGPTGADGPPAMTLISTTTTAAGATSATISSIPQTYKELRLQINFTGSVGGPSATTLTFNGSTAGYSYGAVYGYASGAGTMTPTWGYSNNGTAIVLPGITSGSVQATITDYASTTVHKNMSYFGYTQYISNTGTMGTALWTNGGSPVAITSMGFTFANTTGSTVYTIKLWGIN